MGLEYLKEKKKSLGLTNEELSNLSGVPLGTLNKIFAGQTIDPKFETIKSLCNALNVSLSELDSYEKDTVHTIAPHHSGEKWTEAEINEIERFKQFVLAKRMDK